MLRQAGALFHGVHNGRWLCLGPVRAVVYWAIAGISLCNAFNVEQPAEVRKPRVVENIAVENGAIGIQALGISADRHHFVLGDGSCLSLNGMLFAGPCEPVLCMWVLR